MNYVAEISSFERWLETNSLAPTSQLLWYKLMSLGNRCLWQEWVTVDNYRLMSLIGASEKTLVRAREQLVENGLIEFKKGKKGFPNKYKILSIYCKYSSTNDGINGSTNGSINAGEMTVQCSDINKHKLNNDIKEIYKEKPDGTHTKTTRFVPPTLEEVQAYCVERKNNVDAQRFIDFYTAKGWLVGKNKMKDWKACVRTWENGERKQSVLTPSQNKFVNYEQRNMNPEQMRELEKQLLENELKRWSDK